jgi:hypothetical protein
MWSCSLLRPAAPTQSTVIPSWPERITRTRDFDRAVLRLRLDALCDVTRAEPVQSLEVTITDPSEFFSDVCIVGEELFGYRIPDTASEQYPRR